MPRERITDEQVEREIVKLNNSYNVKLAKAALRLKYTRRQYLYKLRGLEKQGRELAEIGVTLDNLEDFAEAFGGGDDDLHR